MQELSISPEQFKNLTATEKDLFVLDVRNPSEYREFHINGHLIPFMDLSSRLDELPAKDSLIIVHCQHGVRSLHAAEFLRREGYINCYSLSGGIVALGSL